MTCATAPAFWQRQRRPPQPVQRFVRRRLAAALEDPSDRSLLVWPTVLGSPRLLELHPEGIPEPELLERAAAMLAAVGEDRPGRAWMEARERFPDTADRGPAGWQPQRVWAPLASSVSLECGVILLCLTGQPTGDRYRMASAVTLFNAALFHPCHDALEPLWSEAEGGLRHGLQGLILLAAGFYHQQHGDAAGMLSLWRDAGATLAVFGGELETPWGRLDFQDSLQGAMDRLAWLRDQDPEAGLEGLWDFSRPEWELS